MAANDILAALIQGATSGGGNSRANLGSPDLNNFLTTLAENDIYRQIANPIADIKFDTTGMGLGKQLAVTGGQALVSAFLNQIGKNQEAQQLNQVAQILPQLYANPQGTSAPEGVDASAFNQLKLGAIRDEFGRSVQSGLAQKQFQQDIIKELYKAKPALAMEALGIQAPTPRSVIPEISVPDSPLAQAGMSTREKYKQFFQENLALDDRMTANEASRAAREQIAGEVKANTKTIDEAKGAREKGLALLDLAQQAKAGIEKAGYTGGFYPVARTYEEVANLLGSKEAARQLEGDANIKALTPAQVQVNRWPGALSTKEMEAIIGAGVSLRNTPEENKTLADNAEVAAKLMLDYADFIDAFKEANSGSTAKADKLWAEYKQSFPLFDEYGNVNKERQSWQDYFSNKKSSPSAISVDNEVSKNDLQMINQLSEEQLRNFAIEAKRLGLSKEQAQAKLTKILRGG